MINLWDLLVRTSNREPGLAQNRAAEAVAELNKAACMPWQNISLVPSEEGWLIRIHSTYESGEIELLIPKLRDQAVRVLKDTRQDSRVDDFPSLYRAGRYSEAAHVAHNALTAVEERAGFDAPERTGLLCQLARSFMKRGNFHRAEIFFEQALEMEEKNPCFSDAERVRFFNDWGLIHYLYRCTTEDDYVETESRFNKALTLAETSLGPDHPECGRVMTSLARLRLSQFRHEDARKLLLRALEIRQQALGPDHEDLAETILELARMHAYQDENTEAEAAFRRALALREAALGPFHPDVADILFNLADLYYYNQKRPGDAAELMARALDIWEQSLGLEHPLVEREQEFIKIILPTLTAAAHDAEQEQYDDDVEF